MSTGIESLIERFQRMVARDGGELTVLAAGPEAVKLRYRPGDADPECADGVLRPAVPGAGAAHG